ncbi:MAG TPA: hypothetical protein VK942_19445 [Actinomycetes bacterium]|nr:hypothetical protein [Actinomycetes bacterium]
MQWRGLARRLPLAGAAVAGAVVGHALAYALAVPEPGRRLAVLASSGHAYWSAAIAAAIVLGLVSLGATLARHFRAGLRPARRPAGEPLGRLAGRLALLQVTIYLVQELIERAAAGVPLGGSVHGRLLLTGVAVQLLVAAFLAVGLAWAGRVAEVAGRALRRHRLQRPDARPAHLRPTRWVRPARLLAAGLGGRAPPGFRVI